MRKKNTKHIFIFGSIPKNFIGHFYRGTVYKGFPKKTWVFWSILFRWALDTITVYGQIRNQHAAQRLRAGWINCNITE